MLSKSRKRTDLIAVLAVMGTAMGLFVLVVLYATILHDAPEEAILHPSLAHASADLKNYPNDPLSYYEMARYLNDNKQYAEAIPYLKRALQLPGRSSFPEEKVRLLLGNCLMEVGKRKEAREQWQVVLKLMPYDRSDLPQSASWQAHDNLANYP